MLKMTYRALAHASEYATLPLLMCGAALKESSDCNSPEGENNVRCRKNLWMLAALILFPAALVGMARRLAAPQLQVRIYPTPDVGIDSLEARKQAQLQTVNQFNGGNDSARTGRGGDGLYDIYFTNQVGGNKLWKNLGGGKFKNITLEAGVGLPGRISVAASFADIDNDGSEDLFVTTVRGGNVLL
jgi:FG-GAP-like repeat